MAYRKADPPIVRRGRHPAAQDPTPVNPSRLTDDLLAHGIHKHYPAAGTTISCTMHLRGHTEKLKDKPAEWKADTYYMDSPQLPHTYARTKNNREADYVDGRQVRCRVVGYTTGSGGLYTKNPVCIVEVLA